MRLWLFEVMTSSHLRGHMRDAEQWIIGLIQHNNIKGFYSSTTWERLRDQFKADQHSECQMCRAAGVYGPPDIVHHIKHVRQHPELALDRDNLITLCDGHHWLQHHSIECKVLLNIEKW